MYFAWRMNASFCTPHSPASFYPRALSALPIDEALPALLQAQQTHRAVVLSAPPGAGKSTRVPLALWHNAKQSNPTKPYRVWMLEPRRLAARMCAQTLSDNLQERVGETVGYRVRFDEKISNRTEITVVTEGILTRKLIQDPFLEDVDLVILDEFHERSIHADLALAFLREVMTVRDDLRIVVMSATLDAAPIAQFLGKTPIVVSEGRQYPIEICYQEKQDDRPLEQRVGSAVRKILRDGTPFSADSWAAQGKGDLLVFLPGAPEIERVRQHFVETPLPNNAIAVPLYGTLTPAQQDEALRAGTETQRKVILATNIAETSLTLPNISAVVDTGLCKVAKHNPSTGLDVLETVRISQANSAQRAGRAGRVRAGAALRLWMEKEQTSMVPFLPAEILHADLAPVLLDVLSFHPGDLSSFSFFESPPPASISRALQQLHVLGAIQFSAGQHDKNATLTPLGQRLAQYPVHPRLGAMLDAALRLSSSQQTQTSSVFLLAAVTASLLSEPDLLRRQRAAFSGHSRGRNHHHTVGDSDVAARLELFADWLVAGKNRAAAEQLDIDVKTCEAIWKGAQQLLQILHNARQAQQKSRYADVHVSMWIAALSDERLLQRELSWLLLAGYPDRLCVRREQSHDAVMLGGQGVKIDERSLVKEDAYFLAVQLDGLAKQDRNQGLVRMAHAVALDDIKAAVPHALTQKVIAQFSADSLSVIGVRQSILGGSLVLSSKSGVSVPLSEASVVLAKAIEERCFALLPFSEDEQKLRDRIRFAAKTMPEDEWPDLTDALLCEQMMLACDGKRSIQELKQQSSWHDVIFYQILTSKQQRLLDEHVPEKLAVPSGSMIKIDYSGEEPILAVRLQEMFGLAETPKIAKNRIPVLLHLLSPSYRPAQVTRDLRSFWNNTYNDVRRELRARYPKHAWPDDPWTALPQSRPQRKPPTS